MLLLLCVLHSDGAAGIRTHAVPGWKPGAFPLGDARSKWSREWELNPRSRDYRSRALPTELSLEGKKLVPGPGVEPT